MMLMTSNGALNAQASVCDCSWLTVNCQKNDAEQCDRLDTFLQEPKHKADVGDESASYGECKADIQYYWVWPCLDRLVILCPDIPALRETWDFQEDGKGYEDAGDDRGPTVVRNKGVDVNELVVGRPDVSLDSCK